MKRVFISFRAEDRKQIDGLRLLAANPTFDIEFYDESVRKSYDSDNENYIRSKIREKIGRSSVTVCMLSEFTHTSKWVDWELEESSKRGNTIILMGVPSAPNRLTLPQVARQLELNWYTWDHDFLAKLINQAP
jgi:hypothetical protein